jgi:peptidoglycan/LPS O-acetylase OafA/YrhL
MPPTQLKRLPLREWWMSPEQATGSRRLQSIDVLRGIAILLVLAIHIPHDAPGGWRQNPWFFPAWLAEFGYLGVPLFIVISGFCIHRSAAAAWTTLGRYDFSWRQFWVRRFIRLYPPYAVAMAFSLVAAFWLHHRFADPGRFLGWDLVTHALLVHNLTAEFATSLGNGAFWSLGTEEQLYALYCVLLLLLARTSARIVIATAAATTIAWRLLGPHLPQLGVDLGAFHLGKWYQWPLHYWLHWALGALAVEAHLGNRRLAGWCYSWPLGFLLVAVGLALNHNTFDLLSASRFELTSLRAASATTLATLHNAGELLVMLGIFPLLNSMLRRESRVGPSGGIAVVLAWIGLISYSLYLVHIPLIYILDERIALGSVGWGWLLRYMVYGTVLLAAGFVFHRSVERWFLHGKWPRLVPKRTLARTSET